MKVSMPDSNTEIGIGGIKQQRSRSKIESSQFQSNGDEKRTDFVVSEEILEGLPGGQVCEFCNFVFDLRIFRPANISFTFIV